MRAYLPALLTITFAGLGFSEPAAKDDLAEKHREGS
jgi:hypothetical protein